MATSELNAMKTVCSHAQADRIIKYGLSPQDCYSSIHWSRKGVCGRYGAVPGFFIILVFASELILWSSSRIGIFLLS